jgi:predicted metalloprotease with PDZ domain
MRLKSLLFAFSFFPALLHADLHYTLKPDVPAREFAISINLDAPQDSVSFHIPAWTPGFYYILQFQDKVSQVRATDPEGKDLVVTHPESRAWTVENPKHTPITFSYRVLADDPGLGFFACHMGSNNGYLNGPSAFMYVEDRKFDSVDLTVKLPPKWDIATPMDQGDHGAYYAQNYDEFIDQPLQLGVFTREKFAVNGIPFEAIFVSEDRINCDTKEEAERLKTLSFPALQMFKGSSFKRYLYILHLKVGNFAGGLEHRASNVQAIANSPTLHLDELATHEYFHAWNVKQIRPFVLGPFDYTKEVFTNNLWFSEGITDYYAYLTAYRSGIKDKDWLMFSLGNQIHTLQRSKVAHSVSLAKASQRAWESGGLGIGDFSYYNKGLVAGLIFDAAIRKDTKGQKSLDDVMRLMYQRYQIPAPGFPEDGIIKSINEVTGKDLSKLYHKVVETTDDLPYDILEGIGIEYDSDLQGIRLISSPSDEQSKRLAEWLDRPK